VQVPKVPASIFARAASMAFRTCSEFSSSVSSISRSSVTVAVSARWLSTVDSPVSSLSDPGFSPCRYSIASRTF
jgi:hypothetical protein